MKKITGFAFGLALLAGSAQAQEPCPFGDCPPSCSPGLLCGPIAPGSVTGSFLQQKPNLTCVYQCSGQKTCTNVNFDCSVSERFLQTVYFRARVQGYGLNQCPQDQETATAVCRVASKDQ
jgi:hypothetical protein